MTSPFDTSVAPISRDDDEIRAALAEAEIPPLLPALAYATGDLSLLRDELRPDPMLVAMPQGGLTDEQQAEARELALDALRRVPRRRLPPGPAAVGRGPAADHGVRRRRDRDGGRTCRCSRRSSPTEARTVAAPGWHKADIAPDVAFRGRHHRRGHVGAARRPPVAAGRRRLRRPGEERRRRRHLAREQLSRVPGRQPEPQLQLLLRPAPRLAAALLDPGRAARLLPALRRRVRRCATTSGSAPRCCRRRGRTRTRALDGPGAIGRRRRGVARVERGISAVGQLNRPSFPDIDGRGRSRARRSTRRAGTTTSTSRGKRVAVIGTGASAVQFIPEIAPVAGELVVFQRTPPWFGPTEDYHDAVADGLRWLYRHVPSYSEWNRFCDLLEDGRRRARQRAGRPDMGAEGRARERGQRLRPHDAGRRICRSSSPTGPTCSRRCTPTYPPGAKRMLRDNGIWARTLKRDNVELVSEQITEITPQGVVTADGVEHEVDVIIYGTGFKASEVPDADDRSPVGPASTCTSNGTATLGPTSASPCRASRTCSASTGRTRTSW